MNIFAFVSTAGFFVDFGVRNPFRTKGHFRIHGARDYRKLQGDFLRGLWRFLPHRRKKASGIRKFGWLIENIGCCGKGDELGVGVVVRHEMLPPEGLTRSDGLAYACARLGVWAPGRLGVGDAPRAAAQ
ncbi:hypothetical protein [Streptomyces drozdowiczii]|uniref:Uncharacterized protein n=1 Tax=Streptomyces drozdowiczii TaxID=202862 RepID=A0ABY6Q1S0_9ACTN|nr:hypothetical protein [Streptomyces drozdowiczii]MCX0247962.1 hypothetical protein [Streptomyces drozdowiczii]UZK58225.1 hypothetical protein NEH16_32825 [Streptomyces drozdowiczii]